jgi:hypothetical protein
MKNRQLLTCIILLASISWLLELEKRTLNVKDKVIELTGFHKNHPLHEDQPGQPAVYQAILHLQNPH